MAKIENSMECLDALMDKMLQKGIASVSVKDGDFEIKIETVSGRMVPQAPSLLGSLLPQYQQQYIPPIQQQAASIPAAAPVAPIAPVAPVPKGNVVKCPIVGTFYASASPKDEPFVKVGQQVSKGDVIFIVESMKVMNEVKSEFDGTVTVINVKSGEAVEFDQPIMIIE